MQQYRLCIPTLDFQDTRRKASIIILVSFTPPPNYCVRIGDSVASEPSHIPNPRWWIAIVPFQARVLGFRCAVDVQLFLSWTQSSILYLSTLVSYLMPWFEYCQRPDLKSGRLRTCFVFVSRNAQIPEYMLVHEHLPRFDGRFRADWVVRPGL